MTRVSIILSMLSGIGLQFQGIVKQKADGTETSICMCFEVHACTLLVLIP